MLELYKSAYGDNSYVSTPPILKILVLNDKCTSLYVSHELILVPRSGSFRYLKVYFDKCFPTSSVSLTASIDKYNGATWFSLEESTLTLTNSGDYTTNILMFEVKNVNYDAVLNQNVTLTWTLDSDSTSYYETPPSVQIQAVDNTVFSDPPFGTILETNNSVIG